MENGCRRTHQGCVAENELVVQSISLRNRFKGQPEKGNTTGYILFAGWQSLKSELNTVSKLKTRD